MNIIVHKSISEFFNFLLRIYSWNEKYFVNKRDLF